MDEHKKERQPPKAVFLAINMFKHALHAYVHTICSLGPFHMEKNCSVLVNIDWASK